MDNHFIVGALGWLFPGGGHLIQGRLKRGIIVMAVIWVMFVIAIISGGAHYPGFDFKDGMLLYMLNVFGRLGNGLGAIVSWIIAANASTTGVPPAALPTFEYGGRFLEVAGLLNYLAVIDAVDIALGRKK
ncbi:MAG TPA: DUF6677 family protein [Pyrinomonadaceae bacterium]